jgi:hypothetical protein
VSEDEQCGRWETTSEVKQLRKMVTRLALALSPFSDTSVQSTYVVMGMPALVKEAQDLLKRKTD